MNIESISISSTYASIGTSTQDRVTEDIASEGMTTATTTTTIISKLEVALTANGIIVPDEGNIIQNLLDEQQWIYPSHYVESLTKKLSLQQLYSVFNSQHHLQSSTMLFEFILRQQVSVVVGHKAQGKTQFLFFVFKLLQAMGEKVLFLDRTLLPTKERMKTDVRNRKFCGHFWKNDFLSITENEVKDKLDTFLDDRAPKSFGAFVVSLKAFTRSTGTRVWVIIDDVVLFENFNITLPDEQAFGSFHWIMTGSAGLGSWVGNRHLENMVFDLPMFTKQECLDFALKLSDNLQVRLEDAISGIRFDGIADWLEERFGGVIGYIAEMLLDISDGGTVSDYISDLSYRVRNMIKQEAGGYVYLEPLCKSLLIQLQSPYNNWRCLRNTGLCWSSPPRGIMFSLILENLTEYYPQQNLLDLVGKFRPVFSSDPGLHGCLLELEEILKLKAARPIRSVLLTPTEEGGWTGTTEIALPTGGIPLNVLVYREEVSRLQSYLFSTSSVWYLIEFPSGFDVIDVVLVKVSRSSPAGIYGIKITRSGKPFATHHTFETCPPKSKKRLAKLWDVISKHFKLDTVDIGYVMLAPNCEKDAFKPQAGHGEHEYYFAPSQIVSDHNDLASLKKRKSSSSAR